MRIKRVDLDRLRSISFGGRQSGNVRIRTLRSAQGRKTGYEIDHADGRVEAVVRPQPVRVTKSVTTGEVTVR